MILCSGCFDGLHAGHVRYLEAAAKLKTFGEDVVVSVAPDSVIQAKGREPRWKQGDRAIAVAALRSVDFIMHQYGETPAREIREMQPRYFVKGEDWAGKLPKDVLVACREVGCTIVYVDTPGTHTSETL